MRNLVRRDSDAPLGEPGESSVARPSVWNKLIDESSDWRSPGWRESPRKEQQMQKLAMVSAALLLGILNLAPYIFAQQPGLEVPLVTPGPGWKPCPRCENPAHIADERQKMNVDTHSFDSHDLSGVWGYEGVKLNVKVRPPFTPEGQKLYDAMQKVVNPKDSD